MGSDWNGIRFMTPRKPIDFAQLRTVPLSERSSKVQVSAFAGTPRAGVSFAEFLASLPMILAGQDLHAIVKAIADARRNDREVVFGLGAHVVKCGLNPVIIELLRCRAVTALALNGAGPIHDVELALSGKTSEDVEAGLRTGEFGMAREPGDVMFRALSAVDPERVGLGAALGQELLRLDAPYRHLSLLATAAELNVPCTVHVAIGTDIVHMRPEASGAAIGAASLTDFRLFAAIIANLDNGVFINAGSAVILPEVFLKALAMARNLAVDLRTFTTVNLDMHEDYRPIMNVVKRPAAVGGQGYALAGRHEIMIPLLAHAVLEDLATLPPSDTDQTRPSE